MAQPTTRRALFGSAAAAGVALIAPIAASAAEPARTNPRLLRAIALRDKVALACATFDRDVELPARAAHAIARDAAMANAPPPIPHETTTTTFINLFDDEMRLSTEDIGSVASARRVLNDTSCADMGDEDWRVAHRELVALADRRDAAVRDREAQCDAIRRQVRADYGLDRIAARAEALAARECDLWCAVLSMPATSMADVATKLDFVARTDRDDAGFVLDHIGNDVRRLVSKDSRA